MALIIVLFTGSWQASFKVDPATLPTFLTSSQVFKVTDKDTVVLPCEVSNPGKSLFSKVDAINSPVESINFVK